MGALRLLGLLAASAVLASEMPRAWAWPLAVAALAHGHWLARREAARRREHWVWPAHGPVTVDDRPVERIAVQWRGPWAFVRWRDGEGRLRRSGWWPDTLDAAARRELRLALMARPPARSVDSMAP